MGFQFLVWDSECWPDTIVLYFLQLIVSHGRSASDKERPRGETSDGFKPKTPVEIEKLRERLRKLSEKTWPEDLNKHGSQNASKEKPHAAEGDKKVDKMGGVEKQVSGENGAVSRPQRNLINERRVENLFKWSLAAGAGLLVFSGIWVAQKISTTPLPKQKIEEKVDVEYRASLEESISRISSAHQMPEIEKNLLPPPELEPFWTAHRFRNQRIFSFWVEENEIRLEYAQGAKCRLVRLQKDNGRFISEVEISQFSNVSDFKRKQLADLPKVDTLDYNGTTIMVLKSGVVKAVKKDQVVWERRFGTRTDTTYCTSFFDLSTFPEDLVCLDTDKGCLTAAFYQPESRMIIVTYDYRNPRTFEVLDPSTGDTISKFLFNSESYSCLVSIKLISEKNLVISSNHALSVVDITTGEPLLYVQLGRSSSGKYYETDGNRLYVLSSHGLIAFELPKE